MDQYHEGAHGTVFDGELEPSNVYQLASDRLGTGTAISDAIALVAACRDSQATMMAYEVEIMRDGTSRVMSTVAALALMCEFFVESTAIHSGQSPEAVLQGFALRQSKNRHPSN